LRPVSVSQVQCGHWSEADYLVLTEEGLRSLLRDAGPPVANRSARNRFEKQMATAVRNLTVERSSAEPNIGLMPINSAPEDLDPLRDLPEGFVEFLRRRRGASARSATNLAKRRCTKKNSIRPDTNS
jgi:hypothetical protein